MLALPGSAYIYQGEELGLPEVIDLPAEARQDPTFTSSGGEILGRDGCRVPIPWESSAPGYGFGTSAATWLPQPDGFADLAVDHQTGHPNSTLELYRKLLAIRRDRKLAAGDVDLLDLGDGLIGLSITAKDGVTQVVVNLSDRDWPLPGGTEVLVASQPDVTTHLPTDHAVWLAVSATAAANGNDVYA